MMKLKLRPQRVKKLVPVFPASGNTPIRFITREEASLLKKAGTHQFVDGAMSLRQFSDAPPAVPQLEKRRKQCKYEYVAVFNKRPQHGFQGGLTRSEHQPKRALRSV